MKQLIRVTAGGIFGMKGEIPVGSEFNVSPPLPEGWAGKYEVLSEVAADAEPILNADAIDLTREGIAAMEKPELLDLLDAHGWDGDKRLGVDKLRDAMTAIVFVGE